jgi:hypothetical protein
MFAQIEIAVGVFPRDSSAASSDIEKKGLG